jgi:protein TonB
MVRVEDRRIHEMTPAPPPVEEKKVIPPPPVTPPPVEKPQLAEARYLEPVPSDTDKPEEFTEQKDLKHKAIGSENKEGKPDEGEVAPPAPVETLPAVIDAPKEDGNKIYVVVQKMAEFKGGLEAMRKFLRRNFKYPRNAQKMGITGRVYVRFVVRKNGAIEDVTVQKGMANCNECNEEALRIVRMMPAWEPAEQNGNAVNVYFSLPIIFQLND